MAIHLINSPSTSVSNSNMTEHVICMNPQIRSSHGSEVGGCSTRKSFRFVRAFVRAVWLPSGIGSKCVWAAVSSFPCWSLGAFPFPFWAWGAFPFPFPPPPKPPTQLYLGLSVEYRRWKITDSRYCRAFDFGFFKFGALELQKCLDFSLLFDNLYFSRGDFF